MVKPVASLLKLDGASTLPRYKRSVASLAAAFTCACVLTSCAKTIHLEIHNQLRGPVEVVKVTWRGQRVLGTVPAGGTTRFRSAFASGNKPYHVVFRHARGKTVGEEYRTSAEVHDRLTSDNTWIINLR